MIEMPLSTSYMEIHSEEHVPDERGPINILWSFSMRFNQQEQSVFS